MFTEPAAAEPETSSASTFSAVADELSPHPIHRPSQQPTIGPWNDMLSANPSNIPAQNITAQQAEMTIEQLLAATADYDSATGLTQTADQLSSTTGLANMMVDEDLMDFWGAAPTTFG